MSRRRGNVILTFCAYSSNACHIFMLQTLLYQTGNVPVAFVIQRLWLTFQFLMILILLSG